MPNTKRLFDKWLKIGEALLLVYPICGLLVAGGDYVSRLLLSTGFGDGGMVSALTAILVGIVPIFFIPTVLKDSMNGLGNIGNKISGIGSRVGRGAASGVRNSEAYKAQMQRAEERRNEAMVRETGLRARIANSKFGKVAGADRMMNARKSRYLQDLDRKAREARLSGEGYDAALIGQQKKVEADQLSDMMTLVNDATRNGEDENKLFELYDRYLREGNKFGAVAVARIAGRRKDTAASFMEKKITGAGLYKKDESGEFILDADNNKIVDDEAVRALYANNEAHRNIIESVAKEMATGENSKIYRSSAPVGFDFVSEVNKNAGKVGGDVVSLKYGDWAEASDNINKALEHNVTNVSELVGMKGSSMRELQQNWSKLDDATKNRIANLASQAILNRNESGAVWDSTKAAEIAALSGGRFIYDEKNNSFTDTKAQQGTGGHRPTFYDQYGNPM